MPLCRLKAGQKHMARVEGKSARTSVVQMKPGDTLELKDSQLKAWADKFELVGPTKAEKAVEESLNKDVKEASHLVVESKEEPGKYNVVNKETKLTLNDETLTKEEAEKLAGV